ncbi:DUF3820 family protein [Marinicella sp. S1101]|uniref:DUF3820 family protein n=1 Tax=Marinicella marina TaxID=2996016 RepID=UPI002260962D|nr:DUF3820 family protein [Marinicella marina]MCX7553056.1 DUF3820 family protein [Marinicella marina]MDJ1139584.1 DUF3820 family protein [Marinicella marina]
MTFSQQQQAEFLKALQVKMPFGKYQGRRLMDLPGHYLAWFNRQGFPDNQLGRQLALVFELDHNGILPGLREQLKPK